jgi:hypothetical protein
MTTCTIVAAAILCTNVQPATPIEAVRVLTSSVQQFVPPPTKDELFAHMASERSAEASPWWPFSGPPDVSHAKPLSEPWSVTATPYGSWFNGQPLGAPFLPLVVTAPAGRGPSDQRRSTDTQRRGR